MVHKLAIALIIVGILGLVALGAAIGIGVTLVSAQGPTPAVPPLGYGPMMGLGRMMGFGLGTDWYTKMQTAVANALGMSLDELQSQLRSGKSIAQIAQSKDISLAKLRDDVQTAHQALIQQAVKDGKLTQAQADWMIQRMQAMDNYLDVNGGTCPGWTTGTISGIGPYGMMGGFSGYGMMGGFGGRSMMGGYGMMRGYPGYGPFAPTPTPSK